MSNQSNIAPCGDIFTTAGRDCTRNNSETCEFLREHNQCPADIVIYTSDIRIPNQDHPQESTSRNHEVL